jgi:hypothetical protein
MLRTTITDLSFLSEEARALLADGEHIQLEIDGKSVGVLLPMEEYEVFRELEDQRDIELVREAKEESGEYISSAELKKELGG